MSNYFTSESVSEGHPDKLADQISDAILDNYLAFDPKSKVACETLVTTNQTIVAGEIKSSAQINIEKIVRETINKVGYTNPDYKFTGDLCNFNSFIHEQSADINQGVDRVTPEEQGAGDQGMMFGYACNETENYEGLKGRYFPLAAALSQRLTRRLTAVREQGILPWSRPDGKSQVTVEYNADGSISRVHTVVIAIQHDDKLKDQFDGSEDKELQYVRQQIKEHVVEQSIPSELLDDDYILVVNGTGRFADPGGPYADAGLTGRKIIVDTYGGMGRHGGGAFSGKDPSKVDRSAAYASRWAAKHVVAAGLADRCEIQLAYVIGVAEPVSVRVETFGTSSESEIEIARRVNQTFDFRPGAISRDLDLQRPIYSVTAAGGHFGRNVGPSGEFPWEKLDSSRIQSLQQG